MSENQVKERESKLDIAGYAYMAGDAALIANGLAEKNYKVARSGALWGLGGVILAKYGRESGEHQMKELCHRLRKYLDANHIQVPSDATAEQLARRDGPWHRIERFLYKYPSEILNAMFAIGGVELFLGGRDKNMPNPFKQASGLLVTAGALAGLLVPEAKDASELDPKGNKLVNWIREKPLRVPSLFYMANNATMAGAAWYSHKHYQENKSYLFLVVNVACYLLANLMLAFSNKTQHKNARKDDTLAGALEQLCAQVVAAQPEEKRREAIGLVSAFLSKQPEVRLTAGELAKAIESRIEKRLLAQKPQPELWTHRVAEPPLASMSPAIV